MAPVLLFWIFAVFSTDIKSQCKNVLTEISHIAYVKFGFEWCFEFCIRMWKHNNIYDCCLTLKFYWEKLRWLQKWRNYCNHRGWTLRCNSLSGFMLSGITPVKISIIYIYILPRKKSAIGQTVSYDFVWLVLPHTHTSFKMQHSWKLRNGVCARALVLDGEGSWVFSSTANSAVVLSSSISSNTSMDSCVSDWSQWLFDQFLWTTFATV